MSELLLRLVELERLSRKTRKAEEKERHQGGGTDPDVSVKKPSKSEGGVMETFIKVTIQTEMGVDRLNFGEVDSNKRDSHGSVTEWQKRYCHRSVRNVRWTSARVLVPCLITNNIRYKLLSKNHRCSVQWCSCRYLKSLNSEDRAKQGR